MGGREEGAQSHSTARCLTTQAASGHRAKRELGHSIGRYLTTRDVVVGGGGGEGSSDNYNRQRIERKKEEETKRKLVTSTTATSRAACSPT